MQDKANCLHEAVIKGFTDGHRYDKYRPEYTPESISEIVHLLTNGPRMKTGEVRDVLELGAGTGKLTKHLRSALSKEIKFVATEPMPEFMESLRTNCPGVATVQCTAESLPFPDNYFQGIVASHCFHWFANDIALHEITRVLQPNGHFVLVWIYPDTRVDWVNAVNAKAMSFKQPNEPRYCQFLWKTAIDQFPGLRLTSERVLDCTFREYKISDLLNFYSTISSFARMPKEEKENALGELANIVESDPAITGKDVFQFPNTVDIYQYTKQ